MNCSNMKKLLSEMEFQYSKKFSFSMVITQDCKWFLFLASLFSCFFPIHCLKIHWIVSRVYSNKKLWGLWSCTFCFNIRPKKKKPQQQYGWLLCDKRNCCYFSKQIIFRAGRSHHQIDLFTHTQQQYRPCLCIIFAFAFIRTFFFVRFSIPLYTCAVFVFLFRVVIEIK